MSWEEYELRCRIQALFRRTADYTRWLSTPNHAYEGRTPEQLFQAGDLEPLRRMLYCLESGEPS